MTNISISQTLGNSDFCAMQTILARLFYHVFFFFFLVIELYFSIPTVVAQIFHPISELNLTSVNFPVMPTGKLTEEAKAETETHLVTVEAKINQC